MKNFLENFKSRDFYTDKSILRVIFRDLNRFKDCFWMSIGLNPYELIILEIVGSVNWIIDYSVNSNRIFDENFALAKFKCQHIR